MELHRGQTYLIVSYTPDPGYTAFKELLKSGVRGLCLTRGDLGMVRGRYGLECPIVLLVKGGETRDLQQAINPEHILKIHTTISEFLKKGGEAAIILDGLEYLVAQNDFTSVLKLLALVNERVALAGARLIIPIGPGALDQKQLSLIERECQRVDL
jgi:hypothetical protein